MKTIWLFVGAVVISTLTGFSGADEAAKQRAPRHISLLIGVGNYEHAATWATKRPTLANLTGPRNDVQLMRGALEKWSFDSGPDQRVLLDSQASKAGIAAAFRWLASRATDSSDVVVIYYAGHGSYAPDSIRDGVLTIDEAALNPGDTFDEGFVPWDALDFHNPRHLVLDDEIGAWLRSLRTGNVTIIMDACFSGTGTRGIPMLVHSPDGTALTDTLYDVVTRGPTPLPRPPQSTSIAKDEFNLGDSRGRMNHTLLTASMSSESAKEATFGPKGYRLGVFTQALVEALRNADPDTRFYDLIQTVQAKVHRFGQEPQLEGHRTARVFRVGENVVVPARGYFRVHGGSRRAGQVRIDVGPLHGAVKGALYDVYGANEITFRGGALAQVRLDSVLEASSLATILRSTQPIPSIARAVPSGAPVGVTPLTRLRLFVDPTARALRDSLQSLEWIVLVDEPARAIAQLRRRDEAYQVLVNDVELPPLRNDAALVRAVAGVDSAIGYTGSVRSLCSPLRRAYSVAAMDRIAGDQPGASSAPRVDIRVLPARAPNPPPFRSGSADTAYLGSTSYNVWAWVRGVPADSSHVAKLYLTVGLAGYTAVPEVYGPTANRVQARLTPEQLRVPILIGTYRPATPGIERIKAVLSSDPFSLKALVDELPDCPPPADRVAGRSRNQTGASDELTTVDRQADDRAKSRAARGWTAAERRIVIRSRRAP